MRISSGWEKGGGASSRRALLFLRFRLLRLQAVEIIRCPLGMGGGAEDSAFVFLQYRQPVLQIGGVIVSDVRRYP